MADVKNVVPTTKKRSLILQYFTKDIYIELMKITMMSDIDNNEKNAYVKDLLRSNNIPFNGLGSGTNRMAVQIDGYAVKIALDKDGMIDNRREMLYTRQLQPYVVKVYECTPNGLIAVTEFVEIFTLNEFHEHQENMRNILSVIAEQFLIGDVGITGKNYVNWGTRNDGTICILDFAYIYSVKYNIFNCACSDDAILRYDKNYVNLICPLCGRKYSFGELRRKITRKQQEEEIGDIRRLSYNLTSPEETIELVPEFEPRLNNKKKKKERSETEELIRRYRKGELYKVSDQDWDFPDSQEEDINTCKGEYEDE